QRRAQARDPTGRNLSSVVADHFSAYAETVDVLVKRLRLQWLRDPKRFDEAVTLSEGLRKDTAPVRIVVLDIGGGVAYSRPGQDRALAGDAEAFAGHRAQPVDELHIGNPLKDESGVTLLYLSRPLVDSKGTFSGRVALAGAPGALRRLYEGLDLGPKGFVGIRRLDDTLFLRWPDIMAVGSKVPGLPPGGAASASDVRQGKLDGVERIFSFQRISGFPFYAVVG